MAGASYFLTLCTRDRRLGLNQPAVADAIREQLQAFVTDGSLELRAWVVMPDHLHLFFRVTGRLEVGQIVGRLKAKTRPTLSATALGWQGNFYEHRLRADDKVEDVLRYLFLNPYRAKLLRPTETYPHFGLGAADAAWFLPTLDADRPYPEWLE